MPIESKQLRNTKIDLSACPRCGVEPFVPFLRGVVQRSQWSFFHSKRRPHCALICDNCQDIVAYEAPSMHGIELEDLKNSGDESHLGRIRVGWKRAAFSLKMAVIFNSLGLLSFVGWHVTNSQTLRYGGVALMLATLLATLFSRR